MTATRPQLQGSCLKWLGSPSGEWETLGEKVPGRAWWRLHVGPCLMFHFCLGGLTATLGGIFYFLNWGVVNFQCCANTHYTTKWFSYAYLYTHILFFNIPLWFLIGYWIWFSVLRSRTLLFIRSIYKSLHLLTPTSQSVSPPAPSPLATTRLLSMFVDLFLFHGYLCHILGCMCKWYHMVFVFLFSDLLHIVCWSLAASMWHHVILFYGLVVLHCVCLPHLLYSFTSQWTFRLSPCAACCE